VSKIISFIIPVYKVEKYINECVDCILNQLTDATCRNVPNIREALVQRFSNVL
jgi:glycosyltransferase involved in cell wall biosynthesis